MQKQATKLIGIIVSVAMIVIAFGGVFLYLQKSQSPITNVRSNSNAQNLNTETADWQTYKNDEYGFEIKYPNGWFLSSYGNHISISEYNQTIGTPNPKFYPLDIFIENNPQKLSAKDYVQDDERRKQKEGEPGISYESAYQLTVGNYPAYKLNGVFTGDARNENIYIGNGVYMFVVSFPTTESNPNFSGDPIEANKIYHNILSTLKFIK